MATTLINALLPIIVVLLLGFFAAWKHDFTAEQGGILTKMVMHYALPMALFADLMSMPKSAIFSNIPMLFWIALGMIGGYLVVLCISHFICKRPISIAALQAIAITGPAAPFVGVSVLGDLFGAESSLAIIICSVLLNLVQLPITLICIAHDTQKNSEQAKPSVVKQLCGSIIYAFKQPVVWAPFLGFVLVLTNIHSNTAINDSLNLLGQASGGVALFASGCVLYAQKVSFSVPICVNILSKNILIPAAMLLIMTLAASTPSIVQISVVSLALPTASISIILAVQYKLAEKEMASTLFLSTVFSVITMGFFIWLVKA